jgi:hypothetical protein
MVSFLISLILVPALALAPQDPPSVELFPNGSLDAWRIVGGDGKFEWDAATQELHGWGATQQNTFLLSKQQWSDFAFEVDLKINAEGNSGVQFRSHLDTAGRVMGYQAEVDPSARSWSGGIYDESRRGWIGSLEKNEAGRAAFRHGEWNHYRIEARGPWLRTWVNGVSCADLIDEVDLAGHIALQVHSGGTTDMRWRNARIQHLGGEAESAAERALLLRGIDSIPAMGTPGTLAVFGRSAFAVVTGGQKNPLAVAAAAQYGKGRVFAMAHNSYFGANVVADAESAAGKLLRNAITWLAPGGEERSVAFLGEAIAAESFAELGFQVATKVDLQHLAAHNLLVLSGGVQLREEDAALVRTFVARGGGLMTAICPWGWQQVNAKRGWRLATDLGDNKVLTPMGLCFADGYASGANFEIAVVAAQNAHAGTALDALLAGEKNVSTHGLELAVSSLPEDDMAFMWPLQDALPTIDAHNAPSPNQRLSSKEHGLERLAVLLESRKWGGLQAESMTAAPGSDQFPGAVAANAPRVTRHFQFAAGLQGWQSTGLYLAPGEALQVEVTEGSSLAGWSIRVGCHTDQLWHKDVWQRWPEISASWPLRNGATYASPYGGAVYVIPEQSCGALDLQIKGAVEAPLYARNHPVSAEEWQRRKKMPGPWAELVGHYIVLSVPTYAIQDLDNPEALLNYWDTLVQSHYEFGAEPLPTRPERFVADAQISAGYMHSGYPIMTWLDVVTPRPGKLPVLLDLEELRQQGNWGYFHEAGHNRQKGDWTFSGTGEVTNNLFSLHGGEVMAGIEPWKNPWLQGQKKSAAQYLAEGADFRQWQSKPGVALVCYAQIQKQFGWQVFTQVFAEYRDLPNDQRPQNDAEKINQWVLRMSLACGRDLRPFHQKWGWPLRAALLNDPCLAGLKVWMPEFVELE